MPISVVFDPPLPSDSPSTFNTKAFTLLGDLNDWSTQANALPGEVATNLTTLLASPPAIGSTTPAAGSFTTLSVNTVSTDVKAVVGSSVAKATTASTEVVWVKSSDASNALTLAIGINSNATDTSRGAYLQAAEQGVAYRNLLIQPDGGNTQIGSPSGSGAVTIPGGITQESVIAPTLLNSWANLGGATAAGYWKDTFGVVHLQGTLSGGTTTAGTALFTLPSGYRPAASVTFSTPSNTSVTSVYVNSAGSVALNIASSTNISLDGISFKV